MSPHSATSSKSKLPIGRRSATAEKKSNLKRIASGAASKGSNVSGNSTVPKETTNLTCLSSELKNSSESSDASAIRPCATKLRFADRNETLIMAFAATHAFSRDMACSRDELIFLRAAVNFGFEGAVFLAAITGWQCQRPLRALSAKLTESGQKCSVQVAGTAPPKDYPTSC